jgi:hypothetical protein
MQSNHIASGRLIRIIGQEYKQYIQLSEIEKTLDYVYTDSDNIDVYQYISDTDRIPENVINIIKSMKDIK